MHDDKVRKVHFLGIGGSGASAAAVLAKKNGFQVSGCTLDLNTPYLQAVKDNKIKIFEGHDKSHLESVEILATTPAIFFSNDDIEELNHAKKTKKVMSWQNFVGEFLMPNKKTISVAGAHGKSTTTAMLGLILEKAGLDPTVLLGAKVPDWETNFRHGKSEYFVIESDEFFDNYHNYSPDFIILNNIEFDHPDYFKDEKSVFTSFKKFVEQLTGNKVLIVNQDSEGVIELLKMLSKSTIKTFNIYGYSLKTKKQYPFKNFYTVKDIEKNKNGSEFTFVDMQNEQKVEFKLSIPGVHNVSNAMGVIVLCQILGIDLDVVRDTLLSFNGTGRRMELIDSSKDVFVYDDYAHHPTEIRETLSALRQKHPKSRIVAVIEPHSYSRTKALLELYAGVFADADSVLIGPIFKARDIHDFGVGTEDIVHVSNHKNIKSYKNLNKMYDDLLNSLEKKDVVIFMGAGDSYKWARNIVKFL